MLLSTRTAYLETIERPDFNLTPHLRLMCTPNVTAQDIRAIVTMMLAYLDSAREPVHLLIDLQSNVTFPVQHMLRDLCRGPLHHPMMDCWLIVGANSQAAVLTALLRRVARGNTVHHYLHESNAFDSLERCAVPDSA